MIKLIDFKATNEFIDKYSKQTQKYYTKAKEKWF